MLQIRVCLVLCCVGIFGLVGCDCGTAPPIQPGVKEACDALAKERCVRWSGCYLHHMKRFFGDQKTCEEREALECWIKANAPGIEAKRDQIVSCTEQVKKQSCAEFELRVATCAFPKGTLKVGSVCVFGIQCDSNLCKAARVNGVTSKELTCHPREVGKTTCRSTSECGTGSECSTNNGSEGRCFRPVSKAGEPCGKEVGCLTRLLCVNGTCQARLKAGETCLKDVDNGGCDALLGSYCDYGEQPNKCQQAEFTEEGCGGIDRKKPVTCFAGACVSQNDRGSGSCKRFVKEGQPCHSWDGPLCMSPAVCRDEKCVLPLPAP